MFRRFLHLSALLKNNLMRYFRRKRYYKYNIFFAKKHDFNNLCTKSHNYVENYYECINREGLKIFHNIRCVKRP
jgi:hypothetical protein